MTTIEEEFANLSIANEEDEPIWDQEEEEDNEDENNSCLVGKVLTNSAVHFILMRSVLAELWHPIEGVTISKMEDKRILFRFYNELDIARVIVGMPWFFNRHLILFHRLQKEEDPIRVPLIFTMFWVQIHDLPIGSMSTYMAAQLGNFLGKFLKYETVIISMGTKKYMRIKVQTDVHTPLKRRKRIIYGHGKSTYATFKYEKLSVFCFLCGRLGHGESFCLTRLSREP